MTGHHRAQTRPQIRNKTAARLAAALILLALSPAAAAPPEGCSQAVLDAMQATAQAKVAAARAINDEIFKQDDSVLALTCFNQSAALAAQKAGRIFSGDFTAKLAPVVQDALGTFFGNFDVTALGGASGAIDYTANATDLTGVTAYDCDQPAALWAEVNATGIRAGVPYPTFDDLMAGPAAIAAGGGLAGLAGSDFQTTWTSTGSQAAFTAMNAAVTALPPPAVTNFTDTTSPCIVLRDAGATITCP